MANTGVHQDAIVLGAGASLTPRRFTVQRSDKTATAVLVGILWIGVLSGFGLDVLGHVQKHGLDYPLFLHFHAFVFFGWLVLLTAQLVLVRASRIDLHMKLGVAGTG